MARGGRRAGKPGAKYPNRTDLALSPRTAPVAKIPGQGYGAQAAQTRAQQAVPAGLPPAPPFAPPPTAPNIMARLAAPTERPDEPFHTGLPTGPGPGPEILGLADPAPSAALRRWLLLHPDDEDVRTVIEMLEIQGR